MPHINANPHNKIQEFINTLLCTVNFQPWRFTVSDSSCFDLQIMQSYSTRVLDNKYKVCEPKLRQLVP